MAEYGTELPEGMVLDQPIEHGAELPAGATLDPSPIDMATKARQPTIAAQPMVQPGPTPIAPPENIDLSTLNPTQLEAATELENRGILKRVVESGVHYLRPTIEGLAATGGAVGGTIVGAPTGPFAPAVGAVAAAGAYTGTKQALDRLEEWATLPEEVKATPPMQQMKQTMEDFRTGLTFEFGGPAAMKILQHAGAGVASGYRKIRDIVKQNAPALSENQVSQRAAEIIQEHRGNIEQYDVNLAEAEKVAGEIPGFKPTIGQKTSDPGLIKLERGLATKPGIAAELGETQKAGNVEAIQAYLKESFPGSATVDDVLTELETQGTALRAGRKTAETTAKASETAIPTEAPQVTGQRITETIAETQAPLKEIEKEYWEKVPNYEMAPKETEAAFQELAAEPSKAQKTVQSYFDDYQKRPKTIKGLQTTERELNDVIFDPNADRTTKRALRQIKTAINRDFAELGEAAERGDFATVGDKVVHPQKMKEELAQIEFKIATEGAVKPPEPDYELIYKELQDAKVPAIMRQKSEGMTEWQNRIEVQHKKAFKRPIPMAEPVKPPHIATLEKRADAIREDLSKAEPAKNAAIAYANAKAYSKSQITDRFRKGVVSELEAEGKFQAGKRLPAEARPKKLMDVESADSFIKAVGKEKAADIMLRHYGDDMASKVRYDKDGIVESASMSRWFNKNKRVLERYGIEDSFKGAEQAHKTMQAARVAEADFNKSIASKMLNADPQNAIQRAFEGGEGISGKNTGAIMKNLLQRVEENPAAVKGLENGFKDFMFEQIKTTAETIKGDQALSKAAMQKAMRRFAPAQAVLYKGQPEKLKALKTVQKALMIMNRTAKGVTGGSDTAEKVGVVASILHSVAMTPGVSHTVKLSKLGLGMLKNLNEQEVSDFTAKLLYDPDIAKIISKAAGKKPPVSKIKTELRNYMERAAIYSAREAVETQKENQ